MNSPFFKIAAVTIIELGLVMSSSFTAEAKQCVWNKSGFVLNVKWYTKDDVDHHPLLGFGVKDEAEPYREDTFPTAQGRCSEREGENVAVLKVQGGNIAAGAARVAIEIVAAAVAVPVDAAACATAPATGGTGCAAALIVTAGVFAGGIEAVPDAKEVFAIAHPKLDKYTDVWGTVWEPVYCDGCGGPVD